LCECRRIVNAIASHCDDAALGLQSLDDPALLIGQHFRFDVIDAQFLRYCFGCRSTVAGQHDDLHAGLVKQPEGFGRRCFDWVRNTDHTGQLTIDQPGIRGQLSSVDAGDGAMRLAC
jgi:hypothetical protein